MAAILLVEDNAPMQLMLQELLEFGDHYVVGARSGQEALHVLEDGYHPDIIISDLNMPQMDGILFFHEVRHNPNWADIRFIIMSASPYDTRLGNADELGIDGVLPKPFTIDAINGILG